MVAETNCRRCRGRCDGEARSDAQRHQGGQVHQSIALKLDHLGQLCRITGGGGEAHRNATDSFVALPQAAATADNHARCATLSNRQRIIQRDCEAGRLARDVSFSAFRTGSGSIGD